MSLGVNSVTYQAHRVVINNQVVIAIEFLLKAVSTNALLKTKAGLKGPRMLKKSKN